MAPKLPEYYAVDESANFINTNAKTQTDVLYLERDTGKLKLGNGDRYCDVEYLTPSADVNIDADIVKSIDEMLTNKVNAIQFEPPIDKKSAFNCEFGETNDTVARGKHKHNVSDINNLKLPRGVEYPEVPTGKNILFDDGSFGSIPTETTAVPNSKAPISSDWAAMHERMGGHVSPAMAMMAHDPLSISGTGLTLEGQVLRLNFGRGIRDVCPGEHDHPEYAKASHIHTDKISPTRLPSVSKEYPGAVPPTGNPTGKVLTDDGSWRFSQSLSTVTIMGTAWIAPCAGQLVFANVSSPEMTSAVVHMNSKMITRLDTVESKIHGIYTDKKELNIHFKEGDVFQTSSDYVQLGILYQR